MIQGKIKNLISNSLQDLNLEVKDIALEHPMDLNMGDYSTNVAMVLAKSAKMNPKDLAEKIVESILPRVPLGSGSDIERIEAKNGFINFYLSREFFQDSVKEISENKDFGKNDEWKGKRVMVEYTDPNPFKPFHIGHLMNNTLGESTARILEFSGAEIIRANYQGDVGLHIAKAIYGLLQKGKPDSSLSISKQAEYIGQCYSYASNLYEDDENIKKEIEEINKKIYEKIDPKINELYDWGRKITLEAFEEIYKKLGTKFQYYFFESKMAPIGIKIVRENTPNIFEESDGAIVFKAEKYDPKLHTRVFINSKGLPTYEAKDLGLNTTKFEKESLDLSIIVTALEQKEYMKVVQKALSLIRPECENKMKHLTHGMMRFAEGKMSSRKGNIITGESLLQDVKNMVLEKVQDRELSQEDKESIADVVSVGAIKYSILKQSSSGDVIYDFEKSISFEGDSGPYLQYSYTRAKSVLEKTKSLGTMLSALRTLSWKGKLSLFAAKTPPSIAQNLSGFGIEKLLYRFPEVVSRALAEFEPHYIATYLIDLARAFNTFYAAEKIIDDKDANSPYKITITKAFVNVMQNGLYLLGIKSPERM